MGRGKVMLPKAAGVDAARLGHQLGQTRCLIERTVTPVIVLHRYAYLNTIHTALLLLSVVVATAVPEVHIRHSRAFGCRALDRSTCCVAYFIEPITNRESGADPDPDLSWGKV